MTTLGMRALNRALLERQFLDRRASRTAAAAVAHLVGMQAQAPNPPYIGLWTRLTGFRIEELAELLTSGRVVRIALMRGTVHLVTANDCLALRPQTQPALDRVLRGTGRFAKAVDGLAHDDIRAAARAVLAEGRPTTGELGAALARKWPERDPGGLAYAARTLLPLVQLPPRGVWGVGGQTRYATADSWLGRPLQSDPGLAELGKTVLRYLAAYGPATVKDVQTWAGLTRLHEVLEALRPRLRTFKDEQGAELFDVPDAPLPAPDTDVPVRFLPEFDNILLAHADRTRILTPEQQARIFTRNGIIRSTFLVDGFVRGIWSIERRRGSATLVLTPFAGLGPADRDALAAEGSDLLSFAAADAKDHDIRFEVPG